MKMTKNLERMFLVVFLLWAEGAHAAGYTPLVHIPGLPEGGVVDISAYLIGIYNFALSIVGIVAVVELILGGMKYITAAGNPGKAGDARSTIEGAITGLLLALLSWVIIGTINPDILYLKQPGAFLKNVNTDAGEIVQCAMTGHDTATDCVCKDGYEPDNAPTGDKTCSEQCFAEQRCVATHACIAAGSPYDANDPAYSALEGCTCNDGSRMTLPVGSNCSDTCSANKRCGSKFLVIRLGARHGYSGDGYYHLGSDQGFLRNDDEIWEFTLTNDGDYGDFDIDANNPDAGFYPGHPDYNCAILVSNEDRTVTRLDLDENWIYWIREGTRITREKPSLYDQINGASYDCCEDNNSPTPNAPACQMDWAVWGGECDKGSTDHVVMALFGDDVINRCENCNLAEWNGDKPSYRPARNIKCVGGFWQ